MHQAAPLLPRKRFVLLSRSSHLHRSFSYGSDRRLRGTSVSYGPWSTQGNSTWCCICGSSSSREGKKLVKSSSAYREPSAICEPSGSPRVFSDGRCRDIGIHSSSNNSRDDRVPALISSSRRGTREMRKIEVACPHLCGNVFSRRIPNTSCFSSLSSAFSVSPISPSYSFPMCSARYCCIQPSCISLVRCFSSSTSCTLPPSSSASFSPSPILLYSSPWHPFFFSVASSPHFSAFAFFCHHSCSAADGLRRFSSGGSVTRKVAMRRQQREEYLRMQRLINARYGSSTGNNGNSSTTSTGSSSRNTSGSTSEHVCEFPWYGSVAAKRAATRMKPQSPKNAQASLPDQNVAAVEQYGGFSPMSLSRGGSSGSRGCWREPMHAVEKNEGSNMAYEAFLRQHTLPAENLVVSILRMKRKASATSRTLQSIHAAASMAPSSSFPSTKVSATAASTSSATTAYAHMEMSPAAGESPDNDVAEVVKEGSNQYASALVKGPSLNASSAAIAAASGADANVGGPSSDAHSAPVPAASNTRASLENVPFDAHNAAIPAAGDGHTPVDNVSFAPRNVVIPRTSGNSATPPISDCTLTNAHDNISPAKSSSPSAALATFKPNSINVSGFSFASVEDAPPPTAAADAAGTSEKPFHHQPRFRVSTAPPAADLKASIACAAKRYPSVSCSLIESAAVDKYSSAADDVMKASVYRGPIHADVDNNIEPARSDSTHEDADYTVETSESGPTDAEADSITEAGRRRPTDAHTELKGFACVSSNKSSAMAFRCPSAASCALTAADAAAAAGGAATTADAVGGGEVLRASCRFSVAAVSAPEAGLTKATAASAQAATLPVALRGGASGGMLQTGGNTAAESDAIEAAAVAAYFEYRQELQHMTPPPETFAALQVKRLMIPAVTSASSAPLSLLSPCRSSRSAEQPLSLSCSHSASSYDASNAKVGHLAAAAAEACADADDDVCGVETLHPSLVDSGAAAADASHTSRVTSAATAANISPARASADSVFSSSPAVVSSCISVADADVGAADLVTVPLSLIMKDPLDGLTSAAGTNALNTATAIAKDIDVDPALQVVQERTLRRLQVEQQRICRQYQRQHNLLTLRQRKQQQPWQESVRGQQLYVEQKQQLQKKSKTWEACSQQQQEYPLQQPQQKLQQQHQLLGPQLRLQSPRHQQLQPRHQLQQPNQLQLQQPQPTLQQKPQQPQQEQEKEDTPERQQSNNWELPQRLRRLAQRQNELSKEHMQLNIDQQQQQLSEISYSPRIRDERSEQQQQHRRSIQLQQQRSCVGGDIFHDNTAGMTAHRETAGAPSVVCVAANARMRDRLICQIYSRKRTNENFPDSCGNTAKCIPTAGGSVPEKAEGCAEAEGEKLAIAGAVEAAVRGARDISNAMPTAILSVATGVAAEGSNRLDTGCCLAVLPSSAGTSIDSACGNIAAPAGDKYTDDKISAASASSQSSALIIKDNEVPRSNSAVSTSSTVDVKVSAAISGRSRSSCTSSLLPSSSSSDICKQKGDSGSSSGRSSSDRSSDSSSCSSSCSSCSSNISDMERLADLLERSVRTVGEDNGNADQNVEDSFTPGRAAAEAEAVIERRQREFLFHQETLHLAGILLTQQNRQQQQQYQQKEQLGLQQQTSYGQQFQRGEVLQNDSYGPLHQQQQGSKNVRQQMQQQEDTSSGRRPFRRDHAYGISRKQQEDQEPAMRVEHQQQQQLQQQYQESEHSDKQYIWASEEELQGPVNVSRDNTSRLQQHERQQQQHQEQRQQEQQQQQQQPQQRHQQQQQLQTQRQQQQQQHVSQQQHGRRAIHWSEPQQQDLEELCEAQESHDYYTQHNQQQRNILKEHEQQHQKIDSSSRFVQQSNVSVRDIEKQQDNVIRREYNTDEKSGEREYCVDSNEYNNDLSEDKGGETVSSVNMNEHSNNLLDDMFFQVRQTKQNQSLVDLWKNYYGVTHFDFHNECLVPLQTQRGSLHAYNATRESCAVFDVSFRRIWTIYGKDRLSAADMLLTCDVERAMKVGEVQYALLLDSCGLILEDCYAAKYHDCLSIWTSGVAPAHTFDYVAQFFNYCRQGGLDVHFTASSPHASVIALQGPLSIPTLLHRIYTSGSTEHEPPHSHENNKNTTSFASSSSSKSSDESVMLRLKNAWGEPVIPAAKVLSLPYMSAFALELTVSTPSSRQSPVALKQTPRKPER